MGETLLIIDDEDNMRHMLMSMLARNGYQIEVAENGRIALEIVQRKSFDFILCDIRMPELDGIQFLEEGLPYLFNSTVVMMSAYGTIDLALQAIKKGAYDFISKPFKADEVLLTLKKAEERELLLKENSRLKEEIKTIRLESGFEEMVGNCPEMRELFTLTNKVAQYDTSVLILGESGTGKELIAKGIHARSNRKAEQFVAVNCGSIPESLLESEFFGFTRGAFTGADKDKKGLFEIASGGTLFLDEIGELPLELQVKLLRVLQEREIRPLGSLATKKINVRVIAATARDLNQEIEEGNFRQDLLFRLNVVEITLPPLRQRQGDIALLAKYFVEKYRPRITMRVKGISEDALAILSRYTWPGNVRELQNAIEHAMIYADEDLIKPENLPERIRAASSKQMENITTDISSIKEGKVLLEQQLIRKALIRTNGNKSHAAQLLEISYPSLLSKIKEYGVTI